MSSDYICKCGIKLTRFNTESVNFSGLKKWFIKNRELVLAAITNRERDRLLLPRIDARITNLCQQLRRLEKKYQLPNLRVSARDLVEFGIKYPLGNMVYNYQYREPRHSPIRDLDGEPLIGDTEFIQISHSYEPLQYDVRFHLEREIDLATWDYNRIDRRNYYKEFMYDLRRLLPPKFPVNDHLHCLLDDITKSAVVR